MKFISVKEYAAKWGLPERTVRNYCTSGKIKNCFLTGKTWNIPENSLPPKIAKQKLSENNLLKILREQKQGKLKGGIYHKTQIDLTYNSNKIEGSKLSEDQTRYIFETNTIGLGKNESVNVDDIIETTNHFRAIDYVIDNADIQLNEAFIKQLHNILKSGTSDSNKEWFIVGDYKKLPNEVGGEPTTPPKKVGAKMQSLLKNYNKKKTLTLKDIIDFHHKFELIHPFQDGNGRVGRLIMFKECLANNIVPFIISDELKLFYYRGLREWNNIKEYLMDTCLTAQDNYKEVLNYFEISFKK